MHAADNVTNAMSSLVNELTSGKYIDQLIWQGRKGPWTSIRNPSINPFRSIYALHKTIWNLTGIEKASPQKYRNKMCLSFKGFQKLLTEVGWWAIAPYPSPSACHWFINSIYNVGLNLSLVNAYYIRKLTYYIQIID
jgi:hypothetical protein